MEAASEGGALRLSWRRGGPVCGGRLGVISYTLLHTLDDEAAASGGLPSLTVVHAPVVGDVNRVQQAEGGEGGEGGVGGEGGEGGGLGR